MDLCMALWAKKVEYQANGEWLPLLQHLEDTSRVCGFLWNHWLCDGQRRIISGNHDQDTGRQVMLFLGAIHDLGKATPAFQIKGRETRSNLNIELLERLEMDGARGISNLRLASAGESPHNIAGEALLKRYDERFQCPEDISSIVGGHHGRPASTKTIVKQLSAYRMNYYQTERETDPLWQLWEKVQRHILDWALARAGFESASEIPVLSIPGQVQALGLLTMADWIASNTNYFPLIRLDEDAIFDSEARFEEGMSKWFHTYGWTPDGLSDITREFEHRFGFPSRPVQKIFIDTIASTRQPGLFILEAPMGVGKTEAALMGAEQLAFQTDRKGVFFGLPTQATSNGIFPRIEDWLRSISDDSDSKNGLRLIHGKANLNPEYANLTNASNIADDATAGGKKSYEAFITNQWFSGKKTAILDDFVVGTVDQFLLSALKQKHLALRQLGFAKKVVIIDEVHAYDAYMSQYLQMALTWMASYHVPVILLSATLSSESRCDLTKAYLKGLGGIKTNKMQVEGKPFKEYLSTTDYPLITYTDGETVHQVREFPVSEERRVVIERIQDSDVTTVIDQTFTNGGGNIGIIMNTVKRAQELAQELMKLYGEETVELLHSSFLATERVRKETELVQMLGKGSNQNRPEKKIVVGTQVIEQSLDIDFDIMISELAPIDLLIQRLGRLHRHDRVRPFGCEEPKLYLLGCRSDLEFQEGSEAVYGGYLLARSQYFLGDDISLPKDISPLVQAVYGDQEIILAPQEKEKYDKYKQEADDRQRQKKDKSEKYRLKSPYLGSRLEKITLHGWLENLTEDKSNEGGHSQVRDTDESIEVIALQKLEHGYGILFGEKSGQDLSGRILEEDNEMKIVGETIRLPRLLCMPGKVIEKTIHELEDIYRKNLIEWDESSWLKGSLGILFDEEMNCRLNGYLLHYDQTYGLTYQKEVCGLEKV
ncbi:MAG: CRISPR-associated helicase Cas3' [Lachnospiraceae bacterium]|nr:CRISPR-associated helicase Cas3' [Lachnospiraceae bacterium]